jgi:oligopeptide/dipeptide ABC transporter ATP-binding protein
MTQPTIADTPLLEVSGLTIAFPTRSGVAVAANGVDLRLERGGTLGLVGESGCGKSVSLRAIMGLVPRPGAVIGGSVRFLGRELIGLSDAQLTQVRGSEISMIFQDPSSSLNPVLTVGDQITETLHHKLGLDTTAAEARSLELLERVGIPEPRRRLRDYPHQLSGGMRQRVMIALAIAPRPALLLADEPTTALDVSVQDQILALLAQIRQEDGMAMILVSHDVGVIAENCEDVAVMYAGYIVERGSAANVLGAASHPYTRGLLAALPEVSDVGSRRRLVAIPGQPPNIADLPPGCPFSPRCPIAMDACSGVDMALQVRADGHLTACPFSASSVGVR